jgi:hypothetical protein
MLFSKKSADKIVKKSKNTVLKKMLSDLRKPLKRHQMFFARRPKRKKRRQSPA